ncbi:MAG: hypothetical protein R3C25_07455 [Hyphomonadaceae bacterium]
MAWALLALSACGDASDQGKTEQSSAERVSAQLDVCGQSDDPFARRVCGNGELAALDNQVRETLVAESASVSDAGAQLLVQHQARWREAARVACGVLDPASEPTPEQQRCLEAEFRARVQDARNAVQDVGGYTFQRMELVEATPVAAEIAASMGDSAPVAIERDIRFPRIDGPQTPEIRRFNELVAQQPQYRLEDATNENVDYVISYAGPELISVKFIISADSPLAANSTNTVKAVTVVMLDGGRPLTEADVFTPNSGWQDFVTRRAVQEISRQFPDYANFPPRRDVYETATKPHLWLISEQALVLMFPPLSFGGSHADGGVEVSIPWADLRQFLNPAAPAPIRPSA